MALLRLARPSFTISSSALLLTFPSRFLLVDYTPYTRAFALDQLARKVIHDLRVSSLSTHPTVYSSARQAVFDTKDRLFASHHVEKDASKGPSVDYGFDERLRVNEIGPLLLGQQDQFKDFLHPNAIPGSYLWSDIMLYE